MPTRAGELHDLARSHGQNGDYAKAIELLNEAHRLEPDWPYPVYDLAFTYLLLKDFDKALAYYKMTDQLSPEGFFTSKTAVHTLEKESKGELPRGTYYAYLQIEWAASREEKIQIALLLTEKIPRFAPAWKEMGFLLEDPEEKLTAFERGLSCDPDAETKGMLLINKALLLNSLGRKEEARKIAAELMSDSGLTANVKRLAAFSLMTVG